MKTASLKPSGVSRRGRRHPWANLMLDALILILSGLGSLPKAGADTLAVSAPFDNKIYYVSPAGTATPVTTINYYPEGVAFGPGSTTLYVANWGGNWINRVSASGSVSVFVTNIVDPYGLAFDSKSNLFVACSQINRVRTVSPAKDVTDFATVAGAYGLAFDAADNLYVSGSSSRLTRITPAGNSAAFGPSFPGVGLRGVAVDANGFVYVAAGGSIARISPGGDGGIFATALSSPVGLAFDNTGYLYAANLNDRTISRIDTNGMVTTFATIPGGAKWIAVYPALRFNPGPIAIAVAGGEAVLNWTGNFTLQCSPMVGGSYSDVAGATSPYTNRIMDESGQFFRLRN